MEVLSFTKSISAESLGPAPDARASGGAFATGKAGAPGARSNRLLMISAIANIVTLAVALIALQLAIASSKYRRKSEDQTRQLQELTATVESMRQSLGQSLPTAATRSGGSSVAASVARPAALFGAAASATLRHDDDPSKSGLATGIPSVQPAYQPAHLAPSAAVLQVAALVPQADALALATELQQKGFPAFVLEPDKDQFYRVQVGPYSDLASAKTAQQQLKSGGFSSIIKRRE